VYKRQGITGSVNLLGGNLALFKSDQSIDSDSSMGAIDYYIADGDTGMRITANSNTPGNTAMWLNCDGTNVLKLKYNSTLINTDLTVTGQLIIEGPVYSIRTDVNAIRLQFGRPGLNYFEATEVGASFVYNAHTAHYFRVNGVDKLGINETFVTLANNLSVGDSVGIGTATPEARLHLFDSESGGAAPAATDKMIIEADGNAYINMITGTSDQAGLVYSDDTRAAGYFVYNHSAGFRFIAEEIEVLRVDLSGDAWFYFNADVAGTLDIHNAIDMNDNNVTNAADATADDEFPPLGQMKDSLAGKRPMIYSYTDDLSYGGYSDGYLITCENATAVDYTYIALKIRGTSDSNPLSVDVAVRTSTTALQNYNAYKTSTEDYIDTVYAINDNGDIKFWIRVEDDETHMTFELFCEDSSVYYTVKDSVVTTTASGVYVSAISLNNRLYTSTIFENAGNVLVSGSSNGKVDTSTMIYDSDDSSLTLLGNLDVGDSLYVLGSTYLEGNLYVKQEVVTNSTIDAADTIKTATMLRQGNTWHAYGGFHDSSIVITISALDTWYQITNASGTLWGGDEANGIALSGDTMIIENSGDYVGTVSISYSGLNGQDYSFRIYNVTQAVQMGYDIDQSTTSTSNNVNLSIPLYFEVDAGDRLVLQISNESSSQNPTIKSAIFYVQYLHD